MKTAYAHVSVAGLIVETKTTKNVNEPKVITKLPTFSSAKTALFAN